MTDINLRLRDLERRIEDIDTRLDHLEEYADVTSNLDDTRRPIYDSLSSIIDYVGIILQEIDSSYIEEYLEESDKMIDDLYKNLMHEEYNADRAIEASQYHPSI